MALIDDILALDAVIFDLDGTLIDSPDVYYRMVGAAFERLDFPPVTREAVFHAAKDGDFNWDEVLPLKHAKDREALIAETRAVFREIYPLFFPDRLKMIAGVAEALREIAGAGLKIGIATSTPNDLMKAKRAPLRESGVYGLIEKIVTSDDVLRDKPDPEPLFACAGSLGVSVGKSAYVGDTGVDIRAGIAAGMKTVGVLTGFATREALKKEGPDLILDSAAELVYSPQR
jgi:phosphoglycolate phosphatase